MKLSRDVYRSPTVGKTILYILKKLSWSSTRASQESYYKLSCKFQMAKPGNIHFHQGCQMSCDQNICCVLKVVVSSNVSEAFGDLNIYQTFVQLYFLSLHVKQMSGKNGCLNHWNSWKLQIMHFDVSQKCSWFIFICV